MQWHDFLLVTFFAHFYAIARKRLELNQPDAPVSFAIQSWEAQHYIDQSLKTKNLPNFESFLFHLKSEESWKVKNYNLILRTFFDINTQLIKVFLSAIASR